MVNSQDRVIRVFNRDAVLSCLNGQEPEPTQKLQDLVNRYVYCKLDVSSTVEP